MLDKLLEKLLNDYLISTSFGEYVKIFTSKIVYSQGFSSLKTENSKMIIIQLVT